MRYEIKYKINTADLAFVERAVLLHPSSFRKAFPDRHIHNIYFDSPELACFYENINGDPIRKKARVRWYGSKSNHQNSTLEVKNKNNSLGWKDSYPIDKCSDPHFLPAEPKGFWTNLRPSLYNTYHRSYYISSDRKFRITLDRNQAFDFPKMYNRRSQNIINNCIILELKFDQEYESESSTILKNIPFRQTKFSKYSEGVIQLYDK